MLSHSVESHPENWQEPIDLHDSITYPYKPKTLIDAETKPHRTISRIEYIKLKEKHNKQNQ